MAEILSGAARREMINGRQGDVSVAMGKLIHLNPRPETIQRIGRKMKGLSLNQAVRKTLVTPKEAIIYQGCHLRLIIK